VLIGQASDFHARHCDVDGRRSRAASCTIGRVGEACAIGQVREGETKVTAIVAGVYKQGKVELLETPMGLREGRVRVVLIEDEERAPARHYLVRGKYKGGLDTTLEDFKDAEWHGEEEFDDLDGR
jgi:hypothetical protein